MSIKLHKGIWAGCLALAVAGLLQACGGGGGSSTPTAAVLSLLAGNPAGAGYVDGVGVGTTFNTPYSTAIDSSGNIYVADTNDHTIRKITSAGVVTTLAGTPNVSGSSNGTGMAATFHSPGGIAVDNSGTVYVSDTGNHTIRKITASGKVTTLAGAVGTPGSNDGTGSGAGFNQPLNLAVDAAGNIYVADSSNQMIRKVTPAGVVTTVAGSGSIGHADGTGTSATFSGPSGVAVDASGNVYVADTWNHTIRKIDSNGLVTTIAGTALSTGSTDASGSSARFFYPFAIAVDTSGNLFVADKVNSLIRKIDTSANVTTLAGTAGVNSSLDGTGTAATFNYPQGIALDNSGNLYVADTYNNAIRKVTSAGVVTTLAGKTSSYPTFGNADGTGSDARFNGIYGLAVDTSGNVYAADCNNNTIRKTTPAGVVNTLAGSAAAAAGSADGTGTAATFNCPNIAIDTSGNVYAADYYNSTIRKVTPEGVVTTLAGSAGVTGSTDGTASNARFNNPWGIAVDTLGNVYVADTWNLTIRKITAAGIVSTLAGTAGVSGSTDATGSAASFSSFGNLTIDAAGNLYVIDNSAIRKITPAGVVTTLAGTAGTTGHADDTGSAATFNNPNGIAADSSGNLYVADSSNHLLRKVSSSGVVTTIAGKAGEAGFIPGSLPGLLGNPLAIAISGSTLYTTANDAIVQITNKP